MNVLLITDFVRPGGVKTHFWNLTKLLTQEAVDIKIVVSGIDIFSRDELEELSESGAIRVFLFPKWAKLKNRIFDKIRISSFLSFLFLLTLTNARYDKVIISTGTPYKYILGGLIWGKKFIYILHTYPHQKFSFWGGAFHTIQKMLIRMAFLSKMRLVTVSQFAKKRIESELGIIPNSDSIISIPNASMAQIDNRNRLKDIDVLTFGHVVKHKNPKFWLKTAIEVVKNNPDCKFVWAGDGELLDIVKNWIPPGFQENIKFVGWRDDVSHLLSRSRIYFQPSLIESQGISVLDAMASAIPCVVSNTGGLKETVLNEETGYIIDLNSTDQATDYLHRLINDRALRDRLGEKGQERFNQNYTLDGWNMRMWRLISSEELVY